MSLVNIMFRSNRTFCFSQNQTTYSVALLITAWLVIVEAFGFMDSGVVDRHNFRIWGNENSHVTCELERGIPKVNVWAGIMHNLVIGYFFSYNRPYLEYRTWICWKTTPSLKPSCSKTELHRISTSSSGSIPIEKCPGDGSAEVSQLFGLLGPQT